MRVLIVPMIAAFLSGGAASPAAAHCCHDDRMIGVAEQSDLRRGTHRLGDRRLGEFEDEDGASIGRGLGSNSGSIRNGGGLGGMRGNGIGNYGAGSLGERGPGGLGTMTGDSIHRPAPRPR